MYQDRGGGLMARARTLLGEITLNEPVDVDGTPVTVLNVYKPRGKDLRATMGIQGEEAKSLRMLELCCDITPSVSDEMEVDEIKQGFDFLAPFF
jgi:hypothetical protein